MKRFLIITAALLTLGLASCGPLKQAGDFIESAQSTVKAPITMYRVNLAYDFALTVENEWQDYCWGVRPGAVVALTYEEVVADPVGRKLCAGRRATLRQIQNAKAKVRTAIDEVERFGENPNRVAAAWTAVTGFQRIVQARRAP